MTSADTEARSLRRQLAELECDSIAAAGELRRLESDLRHRATDRAHLNELLGTYAPVLQALRDRVDAPEAIEDRLHQLIRRTGQ